MDRVFTQTFAAVGCLIERDGKILLIQEGGNFVDTGKWNLPAGLVDVGENPFEAAVREAKEETGFDVRLTALFGIYSLVKQNLASENGTPHVFKLIFKAEIIGGELMQPNEEIADLRWYTPEEVYALDNSIVRDKEIKQQVKDYFSGREYPLEVITHTIQT